MFDVFYSGRKPNQFAHEREAQSIEHAQQLCRTRYFWWISYLSDYCAFDFDYEPAPWQSEFTHTWPSQHHDYSGTYLVPAAGEIKYHFHTDVIPNKSLPTEFDKLAAAEFDYTWAPHPFDPPYIYVFGNQWHSAEIMPTVEYHVSGATERKYIHWPKAQLPQRHCNRWHTLVDCDWDYSWQPDPGDPPYIYVFGNQWWSAEVMPTVEYHVPGATERKYMHWPKAQLLPDRNGWTLPDGIEDFDLSWCPDPGDPPMIYQFGTQWQRTGGPVYTVAGAYEIKYVFDPRAVKISTDLFWSVPKDVDTDAFDWTWHPDATDGAYIYQFGTQWQRTGGPVYTVPGATEVKYVDQIRIASHVKHGIDPCWTIPDGIDTDAFDWTWHPDATDGAYIYQFGTQWQRTGGPLYTVPGATEVKYVSYPRAIKTSSDLYWTIPDGIDTDAFDWTWHPDATDGACVYQFGTQWQRTGGPVYTMPDACEIKYINNPRAVKTATDVHWTIPDGIDTTTFDWTWHPDATDGAYIYQFGTQHQRTGGPAYVVSTATEVKYVDQIRIASQVKAAIYEMDHLDHNAGQILNSVKTVRYFDNYRDTLIRLAKSIGAQHEWVWVCSSICDYTDFDFSWHPEQWQATMLHVFPSNDQKFGDTFYMHVPTFAERAEKKALLEWYDVNFVDHVVPRRPLPVIEHLGDSNVDAVKTTEWPGPLALFTTNGVPVNVPAVNLWRSETKTITPLSAGASAVIVPRMAVPHIKTQLYDYPYIDKKQQRRHSDTNLDIVFISNGEINADENYTALSDSTYNRNNIIHRVSNVNGRVAAYHAAAAKSSTPWFFAVFAKLRVSPTFNWDWQPDRMQQAKHYIFHATNPVNGLEYGHQAMIAYNKQLTLANPGAGLDFTLDSAHEVVPVTSGIAYYNSDPWTTWRTAFREALKLRASLPDVENDYRLKQWLTVDNTQAKWSMQGAQDAVEYYEAVNGDPAELRKSYEWDWLASYAFMKRNLLPDWQ